MSTSPHPPLTPVPSRAIKAVGHDGQHLYVQFPGGAVWKYHDFSAANHAEMMAQDSIGGYFHRFVKPNHTAEKVSG